MNCGAIQFIDFIMVSNEDSGMDIKLVKGTPWGEERGAVIKDSVIVGHTDLDDNVFETKVGIVSYLDILT